VELDRDQLGHVLEVLVDLVGALGAAVAAASL
jgi:hypothetical protein